MNYAFKMMAVVVALGVLVFGGTSVANADAKDTFVKAIDLNQIDNENINISIRNFIKFNKDRILTKEARYIAGRIFYYQKEYEQAAIALAEFNSYYPSDSRFQETAMLIGKSATKFTPKYLTCDILTQSIEFMTNPSTQFKDAINDMEIEAGCKSGIKEGVDFSIYQSKSKLIKDIQLIFKKYNLVLNKNKTILQANGNSWVEIEDEDGNLILQKLMRLGDEYVIPNNKVLYLSTGNAGALSLHQGDNKISTLGEIGEVFSARLLTFSSFNRDNINSDEIQKKIRVSKSKPSISSTKLEQEKQKRIALERKVDEEERKRKKLERRLAVLDKNQKQEQQRIDTDTKVPLLEIISIKTKGKRGTITGIARDNVQVAEVTVDGKSVSITSNGNFKYSTYVPPTGKELKVQVTDIAGLTSSKIVVLKADRAIADSSISFDSLNPLGKRVSNNKDALALIVGVSSYENTKAKAMYADNDALVFKDYATEKLGISENRIKMLINDGADEKDILLSVKEWLRRSAKPNKSDIYVFFAGHGLASQDGKNMYLLPHDGSPRLLDDTAILRDRLFADLKATNPKSVTVFLDTCYSGTTRGTDMLIASRPIAIRALKQSIPNNFTVFSAAAGDQTSKPLEEAKHGMFSYFLMKGMEGDADANSDNKITAQELHNYVKENVTQQSSGSQTPELQGDKDRVLVQFN